MPFLLAQTSDVKETILSQRGDVLYNANLRSVLSIIGLGVVLFGLLLLVAYAVHRHFRKRRSHELVDGPAKPSAKESQPTHHRHRHHRHHHHRHETRRNPTLREAGGLPPLRPEGDSPPI